MDPSEEGDFVQAIERFTEAITLDRNNYLLFSNRSAAYARVGRFPEALEDAQRCHELKPDWPKGYYRLGVALLGLERFEEAMIVFAEGLALDQKQAPMLNGLVETMLKSPLRANFQPKLEKFESLKLDKNPFIITSVIGQELQSAAMLQPAMKILEAARAIGTDSLKLRASLLQALGRVHWALGNTDKALGYMQKDLDISEELGDTIGCCRARDNLGIAFFSLARYEEAIAHHTAQFHLTQTLNDRREAINALTRMGNALVRLAHYQQAHRAYKDCLKLAKELADAALTVQAFGHLGSTYLTAGDVDKAITWHHQHLSFAKETKNKMEEAEAYALLGHACHVKGNHEQSMMFYQQLLSVAVQLNDMALKSRAYGGMGQANRSMGNLWHAQSCREQQLKLCKDMGNEEGQATALGHLGHIHKASGKLAQAMQCYSESLGLAQRLKDRAAEGRAYANLGSCHITLGNFREAVNYYKQELVIAHETGDKASEATTVGHLGMAFLALDNLEAALEHLLRSLSLAQEMGDKDVECQALSNVGTYYTTSREFAKALPYLDRALKLAQEKKGEHSAIESKACHNLGLCHEALGHYQQAIQFYQHDFLVAKEAQDKEGMTRACEKLMNAHSEVGDREQAEIYKRKLHAIAEEIQSTSGKCTFWNQIAEDSLNSGDFDKAIEYYENLLKESKREQHQAFEGLACCGLGNAYLSRGDYEHALSYHRRDLTIKKAASDITGECNAYGNMGAAYNSLGQHMQAVDCYEHQLSLAKQLENTVLVTKAFGCLGIVHRNMKNFQRALHYHQQQLASAVQLKENLLEQASAYANLGESLEAAGDFAQAARNYEQHLVMAQRADNELQQMRGMSSLGRANRGLGNFRKALQYFEQQLRLAKAMSDEYIEAECYADIGSLQMLLGDYHNALEAFSCQLQLSRSLEDAFSEALASCGLGEVHARLGNFREAVDYHKLDLRISSANRFVDGEARALGNIAETYESMGDYRPAIEYREKQLTAADTLQDNFVKALAFTGLGKIYIKMSDPSRAVTLLKQALSLIVDRGAEQIHAQTEIEAEAKIRFYLGQAFYYQGHCDHALIFLQKALPLFEHMRQNVGHYDHATKHTLELYPILFQTLVNTLVKQGKVEEALEMAEMERCRAMSEALMQRDVSRQVLKECGLMKQYMPQSSWIAEAIETIQSPVLYFSVALNHVFIWLLHPQSGIVQFQKVDMTDFSMPGSDTASVYSESSSSYIQPLVDSVAAVRESLGIEQRFRLSMKSMNSDDFDSEDNDSVASFGRQHNSGLGPSRLESIGMSHNRGGSSRSINMSPVHELFDILIHPVEYALPQGKTTGGRGTIIIVPDKDLYLVPFGLLKGEGTSECLYERFHLLFAPSLQSLVSPARGVPRHLSKTALRTTSNGSAESRHPPSPGPSLLVRPARRRRSLSPAESLVPVPEDRIPATGQSGPMIVGNPAIPISAAQCNWQTLIGVEKEVSLVADILDVKPLLGSAANKENVMERLSTAECIHFATNISFNRAEIVLAPCGGFASTASDSEDSDENFPARRNGDGAVAGRRGVADGAVNALPESGEYLLTVSEIMERKLSARLVVLSGGHRTESPRVTAKGLMCVAQAFLASGAECVLVPLWPVHFQASRLAMNAFYSSLRYGSKATRALAYAMQVVHGSSKYSHPANWAGYLLMGTDIVLRDRSIDLAHSFRLMVPSPMDYLLATLRTLLAMVISSLKRISQSDGLLEPKYSMRHSVESKVGSVLGWEELLACTGFHFISQVKKDVPPAIVFPEHDDSGIQRKAQKQIEALLGLPQSSLKALGALSKKPLVARPLLAVLRSAKTAVDSPEKTEGGKVKVQVGREAWESTGCKEFLQPLHFEVAEQFNYSSSPLLALAAPLPLLESKMLHFAVTAIVAVFGPEKLMEPQAKKATIETSEL